MTDEIIKFETAKLAKEKGFDIPVSTHCLSNGTLSTIKGIYPNGKIDNLYAAPTQSLLQRWLREKYQINVYPILSYTNNQKYTIELRFDFSRISTSQTGLTEKVYYDTYEEALEEGLIEALKLIKV